MIGIYKIVNPKGMVYIGKSVNLYQRIRNYRCLPAIDGQPKIYNSIKKYGYENHKFSIIEFCPKTRLFERECYWQMHYNSIYPNGLNVSFGNYQIKELYFKGFIIKNCPLHRFGLIPNDLNIILSEIMQRHKVKEIDFTDTNKHWLSIVNEYIKRIDNKNIQYDYSIFKMDNPPDNEYLKQVIRL